MIFLGKNLRHLREKNKLTQKEAGPMFGITSTTWSNYENSVSEPSLEWLVSISKYFGVSLDELILADISLKDGAGIIKKRRHKAYAAHPATAILEEQRADWNYIVTELKQLRKDVEQLRKK